MDQLPIYKEKLLLRQMADGDEYAFEQIFNTYRPKLFTYLLKMSDSREEVEDNVHDVFLKLWNNRQRLPQVENFSAYLFRMARNHALDGLRKMAAETLAVAALSEKVAPVSEQPESVLYRKEVRQFILQAVSRLTLRQREVFMLSRESGLKQSEIAEKMGINVSTVKAHLTDALNALRKEVLTRYGSHAVALFVLFNLCY